MRFPVLSSALLVALLAGCASEPGLVPSLSTVGKIKAACVPIETRDAMAGSATKAAMNDAEAKAYAEYVCNGVAETCSRDPTQPACARDLKRYGLK